MSAPRWQRARVVEREPDYGGMLLWVEVGKPFAGTTRNIGPDGINMTDNAEESDRLVNTNCVGPVGQKVTVQISWLELLPEFADEAPEEDAMMKLATYRARRRRSGPDGISQQ